MAEESKRLNAGSSDPNTDVAIKSTFILRYVNLHVDRRAPIIIIWKII